MSENGEIYTAGKNFTLPPAVTEWTNSTSGGWCKTEKVNLLYVLLFLVFKILLHLYLNREKASQTIVYGGSFVSKKAALR